MNTLEKRLIALQQQLETMNAEVADLLALTSAHTTTNTLDATSNKPLARRLHMNTPASTVGLNRFRQLANEQA